MKNSELKKLISQYKEIQIKQNKKHVDSLKLSGKTKRNRT